MKKRFCAALLALALSLALPCPALGAEASAPVTEGSPKTYEQAVAELRGQEGYTDEHIFETDLCSVFNYSNGHSAGEFPGARGRLAIVYKAGSPLGEGAVVLPPQPEELNRPACGPDHTEISEDKSSLTYYYETRPYGRKVFQVDLASGETSFTFVPYYQQKVYSYGVVTWNTDVILDAPSCAAVLMWEDAHGAEPGTVRDYSLFLFSKTSWKNDKLILPSTTAVTVDGHPQYPTDRAPDELFLNEDGSVLTYVYRFEDFLYNAAGELLHDAGKYTYRVDTATGELLSVDFERAEAEGTTFVDVSPGDWFAPYVNACVEAGLMRGVGEGIFHPQGNVTLAEAATLAARIHHIKSGGDGNLPAAPEDYGVLKVEFENGQTLTFNGPEYRLHPIPMSSVFGADVSPEQLAALDWMDEEGYTPATITATLTEKVGPLPCRVYWNGPKEYGWLRFKPRLDASDEERSAFNAATVDLNMLQRPLPGDWYRDTVYYLEGVLGAYETYSATGEWKWNADGSAKTATRGDFVEALHTMAADMLKPHINDISDYPDAGAEWDGKELAEKVLDFYNAGVMTGKDEFGVFDKDSSLTRAEAAAICARILKPELRLEFQPQSVPEKYSYTLTYLMDDPRAGHVVTYPVLPIITSDGDNNGILTLDGTLLPWPGDGELPVGMLSTSGGLYMSFWFTQPDGSRVEMGGLMDETGTFVVPLTPYCYRAAEVAGGKYLSQTGLPENGICTLWDGDGNATELGSMDWYEAIEANGGYPVPGGELDIRRGGNCYVNGLGHRVSEDFDWMGALTDDGRGFCDKNGKIYRIQFQAV